MPGVKIPARSGIHRLACLSLYRALLQQTARLSAVSPRHDDIQDIIRAQFCRNRHIQSPSRAAIALKAGYEALDLLHGCTRGCPKAIQTLDSLIRETQRLRQENDLFQEARAAEQKVKEEERPKPKKVPPPIERAVRHPEAESILNRPRPQVTGRRRVPVLVHARGIPMLRIKKPQPRSLSRVIQEMADRRYKRVVRHSRLLSDMLLAQYEDRWDQLVGETDGASWTTEIQHGIKQVKELIETSDQKKKEMASKMWEIVLQERELAAKEKEECSIQKRGKWAAKKAASAGQLTADIKPENMGSDPKTDTSVEDQLDRLSLSDSEVKVQPSNRD